MQRILFKEEQIDVVSRKLNVSRTMVKSVLDSYIDYLYKDLVSGKTVKVFNICYLVVKSESRTVDRKTLAYISTEIGKALSLGGVTVLRILNSFEEEIAKGLRNGERYTISGLVRIQTIEEDGTTKLRIRKTTCYNSAPVYVSAVGGFKRKVLSGG
jgi:nucleoid DNA-binding protein